MQDITVEFNEHVCRVMEQLRPRMVQRARRKLRMRDDAEDVVNSALQSAWHHRHKLREKDKISSWIWGVLNKTIASHCRVRYIKERDPAKECSLAVAFTLADPSVSPEELAIKSEEASQLWKRIAALPENRRQELLYWMQRGRGEGGRVNPGITVRVCRTIAMLRKESVSHESECSY